MAQWGFYFDQTRCIGCKTCTVACMAWNEDKRGDAALYPIEQVLEHPDYEVPVNYETTADGSQNREAARRYYMKEELIRVSETEYGTGLPDVDILYLALACGHCEHMACAQACPAGCITKEEQFGAVVVDAQLCISCGRCKTACPFGAPQLLQQPKSAGRKAPMVKCDLCLERIAVGLKPACVAACRTRALDALDMEALRAKYPHAKREAHNLPCDRSGTTGEHTRPNWLFKPKEPRADQTP